MAAVVLADRIPLRGDHRLAVARDATLIVGGALLTAAAAQLKISLGFTPVPITGQTFAVLLVGAGLGWRRGATTTSAFREAVAALLTDVANALEVGRSRALSQGRSKRSALPNSDW